MSEIILAEWRNNAQNVRYPFTDDARLNSSRGVELSQDIFDDARLYPIGAEPGIYLNRISFTGGLITIAVADPVNGELATASFDPLSAPNELELFDQFERPAGLLVSSAVRLASLVNFGTGDTTFTASDTGFAASVAVPMPQYGVIGILVDDTVFTGNTWLVGTDGVVLSEEDGSIRIDVIGDPYAVRKECEDQDVPLPKFCGLKTINNIPPNANGDFKLLPGSNYAFDNILRIVNDVDGELGVDSALKEGCASG